MSTTEKYSAAELRANPKLYTELFERASANYRKNAQRVRVGVDGKPAAKAVARTAKGLLPPVQCPAQAYDCTVGIDPGRDTGVAIRTRSSAQPLSLLTLDFWRTIELLGTLKTQHVDSLLVVIEDPSLKRTMFARYDKEKDKGPAYYAALAQRVGQNMAHAQLLIDYCRRNGIVVETTSPLGKIDAERFALLTGITTGSQHARDAATLILNK